MNRHGIARFTLSLLLAGSTSISADSTSTDWSNAVSLEQLSNFETAVPPEPASDSPPHQSLIQAPVNQGKHVNQDRHDLLDLTDAERQFLQEHPVVILGHDAAWPPIDFTDEKGRARGITQDYVAYLSEMTGIHFRLQPGNSWADMTERAKRREIDVVADLAWTEERSRLWNYASSYYRSPYVIFTRRNEQTIQSIKDLSGKRIAAVKGFKLTRLMQRDYPRYDLHIVKNPTEAMHAVFSEQADPYVGNQTVGLWIAQRDRLLNLKVSSDAGVGSSTIHFASRKDWPELATIISKALAYMPQEHRQAIESKWLAIAQEEEVSSSGNILSRLTPEQRAWVKAREVVRIGWETDWPPYDFVDLSGKPSGMGLEFVKLFEQQLGLRFEIVPGRPCLRICRPGASTCWPGPGATRSGKNT